MSKTYRVAIALVLSLVLILALSTTVALAKKSSNGDHGDDGHGKPGKTEYHRGGHDGDSNHAGGNQYRGDREHGDD